MPANYYDKFDEPKSANQYDKFDDPPADTKVKKGGRGFVAHAKDTGVSLVSGAADLAQAGVGLANLQTFGAFGKVADAVGYKPEAITQKIESHYSPEQKAAKAKLDKTKGFSDTVMTMVENPSTIAQGAVKTAPMMVAGGGIARTVGGALKKFAPKLAEKTFAKLGTVALGEGSLQSGSMFEDLRQKTGEVDTKKALLSLGSGATTGLFNIVGGALAKKLGFVDVDSLLAGINKETGKKLTTATVAKAVAQGMISEGVLEEMPQSATETMWMNAALDRPVMEGVPKAMAEGGVIGGAMGGGVNVASFASDAMAGDAKSDADKVAIEKNKASLKLREQNLPDADLREVRDNRILQQEHGVDKGIVNGLLVERAEDTIKAKHILESVPNPGVLTRAGKTGVQQAWAGSINDLEVARNKKQTQQEAPATNAADVAMGGEPAGSKGDTVDRQAEIKFADDLVNGLADRDIVDDQDKADRVGLLNTVMDNPDISGFAKRRIVNSGVFEYFDVDSTELGEKLKKEEKLATDAQEKLKAGQKEEKGQEKGQEAGVRAIKRSDASLKDAETQKTGEQDGPSKISDGRNRESGTRTSEEEKEKGKEGTDDQLVRGGHGKVDQKPEGKDRGSSKDGGLKVEGEQDGISTKPDQRTDGQGEGSRGEAVDQDAQRPGGDEQLAASSDQSSGLAAKEKETKKETKESAAEDGLIGGSERSDAEQGGGAGQDKVVNKALATIQGEGFGPADVPAVLKDIKDKVTAVDVDAVQKSIDGVLKKRPELKGYTDLIMKKMKSVPQDGGGVVMSRKGKGKAPTAAAPVASGSVEQQVTKGGNQSRRLSSQGDSAVGGQPRDRSTPEGELINGVQDASSDNADHSLANKDTPAANKTDVATKIRSYPGKKRKLETFDEGSVKEVGGIDAAEKKGIITNEEGSIIRGIYDSFPDAYKKYFEIRFSDQEFKPTDAQLKNAGVSLKKRDKSTVAAITRNEWIGREGSGEVKQVVTMFKGSDVVDFIHEFGEFAYQRLLTPADRKVVLAEFKKDKTKTKSMFKGEWFSTKLEQWWIKEQPVSSGLSEIFRKVLRAIKGIYRRYNGIADKKVPRELATVFDDIITNGRDIREKYAYSDTEIVARYITGVEPDKKQIASQGISKNTKTGWSYDPASICPKQESFVQWIHGHLNDGNFDIGFLTDPANLADLYDAAQAEGVEVPCSYCYVEGSRRKALAAYQRTKGKRTSVHFTQANVVLREVPYSDKILKLPQTRIDEMNARGGLRLFSFSDYIKAAHQGKLDKLLRDAEKVGLAIKAITKNPDFIKDFAHTGITINVSIDFMDAGYGMDWKLAADLANKYPNVKIRTVARNFEEVKRALTEPIDKKGTMIDVVTPYHHEGAESIPEDHEEMSVGSKGGKKVTALVEQNPEYAERLCCREGGKCLGVQKDKLTGKAHFTQCASNCGGKRGTLSVPDMSAPMFSRTSVKPWAKDFPKAFSHTTISKIRKHPDFDAAKAGDNDAALRLVGDLMKTDRLKALAKAHPDAIVVPVTEQESTGNNKIPRAMADSLTQQGLKHDTNIIQASGAKRKSLNAMQRLLVRKVFHGDVVSGQKYIIADDVLTQGGTAHELRHYIENNGGEVVGITSLAFSAGSNIIAIKESTVSDLETRFGREKLEETLREYNIAGTIEALTESEGRAIARFTSKPLESFRTRLAKERRGLISTLHGEEKRDGASFSLREPLQDSSVGRSSADVQKEANKITKGWKKKAIAVDSVNQLPPHLRDFVIANDAVSDVQGLYDPKTGNVYLVSNNIAKGDNIETLILHEVVGHFGFEKLVKKGGVSWSDMVDSIQALKDKNNNPILQAARAVKETHGKLDPETEAKEIIAYLAQNRPTHTLVQRVIRAIRQAMRKLGMEMNISESEIFDMIRQAGQDVKGKSKPAKNTGVRQFAVSPSMSLSEAKEAIIDTPAFQKWFGKSQVIAETGEPLVVYHGTTHDFTVFDPTLTGNMGGAFGAMNYFTSDQGDADMNYAGEGPDLTNRIDQLAEQIESGYPPDHYYFDDELLEIAKGNSVVSRELATEQLSGDKPSTMPVYLKIENPAYINSNNTATWIDNDVMEQYREDAIEEVKTQNDATDEQMKDGEFDDEIYEYMEESAMYDEPPIMAAVGQALRGYSTPDLSGVESIYDSEVNADTLHRELKKAFSEIEDHDTGELVGDHLTAMVFKELGYDGIILENANKTFPGMGMGLETTHYHIFGETAQNIKSVYNQGSFDIQNQDIMMSVAKVGDASKEDARWDMLDIEREEMVDTIQALGEYRAWTPTSFDDFNDVWNDFVTHGKVRNPAKLDRIADQILKNIARLEVNTQLGGHTQQDPADILEQEDVSYSSEEEMYDDIMKTISDKDGNPLISDYAMDSLFQHAQDIITATTSEKRLKYIDRVLNEIHARFDLADLFIEGGVESLNKLAGFENTPVMATKAPKWYSPTARAAANLKQAKGSGKQMFAMIKKQPGVKQEELEWIGLEGWLAGQKKVTREQIAEFIDQEGIQVEEVEKGDVLTEDNFELNLDSDIVPGTDTKFSTYQLSGGKNYKELLLTLPGKFKETFNQFLEKGGNDRAKLTPGRLDALREQYEQFKRAKQDEGGNTYRSSHYGDIPNILAHVRFNERTDADGNRVLFLEEVQSDWHQEGRKRGYTGYATGDTLHSVGHQTGLVAERLESGKYRILGGDASGGEYTRKQLGVMADKGGFKWNAEFKKTVPDAPFKKSWPALTLKRMIRYAADNGFDKIAWTTGQQQADRYDLSKALASIDYVKRGELYNITAWDHEFNSAWSNQSADIGLIEKTLGKEIAEKVQNGEGRKLGKSKTAITSLEGDDLIMGGHGMKTFYDKMLPAAANKLIKKYKSKVSVVEMGDEQTSADKKVKDQGFPGSTDIIDQQLGFPITDQMKDAASEGMPLFSRKKKQDNQALAGTTNLNAKIGDEVSTSSAEYGEQILADIQKKLAAIAAPAVARKRFSDSQTDKIIDRYRKTRTVISDPAKSTHEKQKFAAGFAQQKLPADVAAKLHAKLAHISSLKSEKAKNRHLNNFLKRADELMYKYLRKDILRAVEKRSRSLKMQKDLIKRGRGAALERDLEYLRGVAFKMKNDAQLDIEEMKLDAETAKLTADLLNASTKTQKQRIADQIDDVQSKSNLLSIYGALWRKSADEMISARQILNDILGSGRTEWRAVEEKWRDIHQKNRNRAAVEITGEDNPVPETQAAENNRKVKEKSSISAKMKEALSWVTNSIQSWELMLDILAKKSGKKALQSDMVQHFGSVSHAATRNQEDMDMQQFDKLQNKMATTFGAKPGRELNKAMEKLSKPSDKPVYLYHEGGRERIELSPLQAAYWYQISKDSDNEVVQDTFEKQGITDKTLAQIEKVMGKELKAWADYLVDDFYQEFHDDVNAVYKQMYGIDLDKNKNYVPWKREIKKGAVADKDVDGFLATSNASVKKGSLRVRTKNTLKFKVADMNDVLMAHVADMNHFKAWALPSKEINGTFNDHEIQSYVEQHHGRDTLKTLKKFQEDFAKTDSERQAENIRWLDEFRGNVTKAMVGANPVVFLKQLTSVPAYAADIPAAEWAFYTAAAMANPVKAARILGKSGMMKARYREGFERDVARAKRKTGSTALAGTSTFGDKTMVLTQLGDRAAIIIGGYAVYKHHYKKNRKSGMEKKQAHEAALTEFEKSTQRAQQSSKVKDLGSAQRGESLMRLFTMFMTSPASYSRQLMLGARDLKNDPVNAAKRLFIYGVILPSVFQAIGSSLLGLTDGDDEDEKRFWQNQAKAVANAPFIGVPFVRTMAQGISNSVTGKSFFSDQYSPVAQTFDELKDTISHTLKGVQGGTKRMSSGDHYNRALFSALHTVGYLTGIPTKPVGRVASGMQDAAGVDIPGVRKAQKTDHPVRRSIGWSQSAVGE